MTTWPAPPQVPRIPRSRLLGTVSVLVVLSAAAIIVGTRSWPVPEPAPGFWRTAHVPAELTALLAVSTAVCLAVTVPLGLRGAGLRLRERAGVAWVLIVLAAAAGLVVNAVSMAVDAVVADGAIIPVLHWAITLLPALAAGALCMRRGAAAAAFAALATGVATMPLFALGWALLLSREPLADGLTGSLWSTLILGAAPLGIAVAAAHGWGSTCEHRAAERRDLPTQSPAGDSLE